MKSSDFSERLWLLGNVVIIPKDCGFSKGFSINHNKYMLALLFVVYKYMCFLLLYNNRISEILLILHKQILVYFFAIQWLADVVISGSNSNTIWTTWATKTNFLAPLKVCLLNTYLRKNWKIEIECEEIGRISKLPHALIVQIR